MVFTIQLFTYIVAVKVQRPDMMLAVTLDLYIVRNLFVLGQMIPKIAEECKGIENFFFEIDVVLSRLYSFPDS
jgi:predicted unusual protein kinase regulating ubiquinone biosynthesis (AarF/ABC1/UbiB family)